MANNTIKLNGEEYQFNINSNDTKLTINVDDCYCLKVDGYSNWLQCKIVGNELSLIFESNSSEIERENNIYVYNPRYPDKYAYIAIIQKGDEYSLTSNNNSKTDMTPLIKGEDFTFQLTVHGGNQRCIVKEIREYRELDEDEFIRIPFDNSLNVTMEATVNKGVYNLKVHNSGKVTEDVSYFDIVLIHDNNSSTVLNIRLSYQDISKSITVSPDVLVFKSNGFISNNIIKLKGNHIDDIVENTTNSLDWLNLSYGYDCIYVYADANDSENSRNGVISIYGNAITVKQEGKTNINDVLLMNNVDGYTVINSDVEFREGIDKVSIDGNTIRLQTNTFINDDYVHDSMITISLSGKWADFSTDYDINNEMHIITIKADINPFDTERRCIITIRNAENTEAFQHFLLVQQPLSEDIALSLFND